VNVSLLLENRPEVVLLPAFPSAEMFFVSQRHFILGSELIASSVFRSKRRSFENFVFKINFSLSLFTLDCCSSSEDPQTRNGQVDLILGNIFADILII